MTAAPSPNEDEARRIVTASGLPAPSLWVHSGGGLYPWWLLDTPTLVDDANRDGLEAMSALWQQALQRSAHRLGYDYGAGVGATSPASFASPAQSTAKRAGSAPAGSSGTPARPT